MSSVHYDTSSSLELCALDHLIRLIWTWFFHKAVHGRLELLSVQTGHMTDGLECGLSHARGLTGVECVLLFISNMLSRCTLMRCMLEFSTSSISPLVSVQGSDRLLHCFAMQILPSFVFVFRGFSCLRFLRQLCFTDWKPPLQSAVQGNTGELCRLRVVHNK